jgi:hypothetical protein
MPSNRPELSFLRVDIPLTTQLVKVVAVPSGGAEITGFLVTQFPAGITGGINFGTKQAWPIVSGQSADFGGAVEREGVTIDTSAASVGNTLTILFFTGDDCAPQVG